MIGKEPLLIIGAVDAALIAAQQALQVSSTVHAIIGAAVAGLGYILGRSQVTPSL